jgi:hypothetical protein
MIVWSDKTLCNSQLDALKRCLIPYRLYESAELCEPVFRRARNLGALRRRKLVLGASQVCVNAMSRLILRRHRTPWWEQCYTH